MTEKAYSMIQVVLESAMVFLLLKLAVSKVSLTDTPTLVCKNLFGLTQGIKLLLPSHENHSERYST